MALSSTNSIALAFVKETVIGTTPATPTLALIPYSDGGLEVEYNKITDDSKRADNQSGAPVVTSYEVKGDVTVNMRHKMFEDLLLGAIQASGWATNVAKLGNTQSSFTIEERDASQGFYRQFRGCEVGSLKLSLKAKEAIKATFGFTGRTITTSAATIATTTTAIDETKLPMNAVQNASLTVDGVAGSIYFTELDLEIDHGITQLNAIGSIGSVGSAGGKKKISGSFTGFADTGFLQTWAGKHSSNSKTSIAVQFGDGTNTYTITIPGVYTTKLESNVPIETVRGIKVDFDAAYDTTLASTLSITRSS